MLDTVDWEEWRQRMVYYFGWTYVRSYWQVVRARYAQTVSEFADVLAKESKS